MNILISGATGFVGRHLVPVLQQGGNKLICIVRDKKKAERLKKLQAEAKRKKLGLWKSARPIRPSDYRQS